LSGRRKRKRTGPRSRTAPEPAAAPRSDRLHRLGAALVLLLGLWLNTGTLAPYAATLAHPMLWSHCNYLLNIDHNHFKATFNLLDGLPRDQWEYSVVLRRPLYPAAAYPFMKLLGFEAGGIAANAVFAVGSLLLFWRALQRRLGGRAPRAVLWLLATYPGWVYWAGLPYSYAAIVPLSLLSLILLWRIESLTGWREALLYGLALGVLFTGYDLTAFFGAAGVLLLLSRRLWLPAGVFTGAMLVPQAALAVALQALRQIPLRNDNTEAYAAIAGSYFSLGKLTGEEWSTWGRLLRALPGVTLDNFLYSNFLFLPLLFLLGFALSRRLPPGERYAPRAEACVLAAAVLVFLFNNLAPPYHGWQLRGSWVARLYQPAGVAMIACLAGLYARAELLPPRWRQGAWAAFAVTIAANVWIVFAPVLGSTALTQFVYHRFYRHDKPTAYAETLARYGARPLGFCREEIPPEPSAAATVNP
jgi:hypothetical protein